MAVDNNKLFIGRIQLLHDTEAHWQRVADTFVPLPGEACVTLDDDNKGRVKYGDGIHTWGELPYSNDNHYDGKTIVSSNHVIGLKGFDEADEGTVPNKTSNGIEWITPVKAVFLGEGGGNAISPTNSGSLVIPIAGENLGVVKESEEVSVTEDGDMVIRKVDADKVQYDDETSIKEALNLRTSWKHF